MAVARFLGVLARGIARAAIALAFVAGVVVLLLWLAGKFDRKVSTSAPAARPGVSSAAGTIVRARRVPLLAMESATGTIRAVHESTIRSKLLARVTEVNLKAGQIVHHGEVLVRLDDTDLRAKLQQARATVASAEAVRSQAADEERRSGRLVVSRAVSQAEYEKARAALGTATADLQRAEATVNEVQAMLDWATICSPVDGTVIDKKIDVGDTVSPGQAVLTLYDPKHMQLVASVRESLTRQLQPGQMIGVRVEGLNKQCSGQISEIVPEANSASRSFQVKVTGPCPRGVYSGMFGRILIPLEKTTVLVIPPQAVRRVGQLELVTVVDDGKPEQRAIRTGRKIVLDERTAGACELVEGAASSGEGREEAVEVLSGLREGEQVILPGNADVHAAEGIAP
jgi:RND family efflux transporter MFP subunit